MSLLRHVNSFYMVVASLMKITSLLSTTVRTSAVVSSLNGICINEPQTDRVCIRPIGIILCINKNFTLYRLLSSVYS